MKIAILLDSNSASGSELVRILATLQSTTGNGNGSWTYNAMIFKTQMASALPVGVVD